MPSLWRQADYRRLMSEIDTQPYQDLLRILRADHPVLLPFKSWPQVVEFMHDGSSEDLRKDAVLRSILGNYSASPDSRWTTTLLVIWRITLLRLRMSRTG